MPNWVFNKIELEADGAVLDLIASTLAKRSEDPDETTPFTFQNILPRPESEQDWYNWNITNWGTKWDASDVETQRVDGMLAYRFSSPWSPPFPVIQKLSEQYPSVCITHTFEEEQGWGGVVEFQAGTHNQKDSWDIPESHADHVKRGGECYCQEDEPLYADCFSERARVLEDLDARTREAAVTLGIGWSGTFEELLQAAAKL